MLSKRVIDITGNKYHSLLVVGFSHYRANISYWKTLCDCGTQKVVNGSELKRGGVKSCGCLYQIRGAERRKPKPFKQPKEIKGRIVACNFCEKEYFLNNCFIRERNFCSRECLHNSLLKEPKHLHCQECNKSYTVNKRYYELRGSSFCSKECKRKGMSKKMIGPNAPAWKGGKSYEGKRIRKGIEWKDWRKKVFERDNYTCQDCGIRSAKGIKVELHPHHIKQYALFPELRFEVSNGTTLCKECHKKTDTYLKPPKKKSNG